MGDPTEIEQAGPERERELIRRPTKYSAFQNCLDTLDEMGRDLDRAANSLRGISNSLRGISKSMDRVSDETDKMAVSVSLLFWLIVPLTTALALLAAIVRVGL